ncbi:hypothetical protein JCM11251_003818 [Rhodosporidiobolus azoricus]
MSYSSSTTPSTPPRSSSPSLSSHSLRSKRPLSSPQPSTAPLKRANSEDTQMIPPTSSTSTPGHGAGAESGDEGSIGASRLHIASTPRSVSSPAGSDGGEADTTLQPPSDEPPAYASGDEAASISDEDDELPSFAEARGEGYNGPAGDNQLSVILELKNQPLEEGDTWFLISRQWFRRWQTACSGGRATNKEDMEFEGLKPEEVGPVDNGSLLEEGPDGVERLRKNPPVRADEDVVMVPAPAFRYLEEWHGLTSPSHSLSRTVLSTSGPGSESIEFYPPLFRLFLLLPSTSSSPTSLPTLPHAPSTELASSSPFSDLLDFAREAFSLPAQAQVRLWRLPPAGDETSATEGAAYVFSDKLRETGVELLQFGGDQSDVSLADALLSDPETRIAVEVQNAQGEWVVDAEEVSRALGALESAPSAAEEARQEQVVALAAAPEKDGEKKEKEKKHHHHTLGGIFSNGWSSSLHHHSSGKKKEEKDKKEKEKEKAAEEGKKDKDEKVSTTAGLLGAVSGALTRSRTLGSRGEVGGGRTRGLVGLQNLGNTCFMNSAIQCMSNTKELQEYFLSGVYKSELNPSNPLGMRGQVATAFGELIERLWHGTSSSVAPREFKQALARFAPQFSGYGQQDSQELLAFLLDGTHEDLNRILKKPATEAPDWEGGGDKELVEMAKTCWEQYRARNDSVIVDLFQGQYRSTVVCPDCDKVSITFDPFMYVTTNLPVVKKWEGKVFVVPLDTTRKVHAVDCEVPKSGTIKTLKSVVGKLVNIDPKRLIITEEFSKKFWKEWNDDEAVTEINARQDKIIFFETPTPFPQPRPRGERSDGFMSFRRSSPAPSTPAKPVDPNAPVHIVVAHRKVDSSSSSSSRAVFGVRPSAQGELFGSPFVITLSAQEACSEEAIRRKIVEQYARVTKRGAELKEFVEDELEESEEERRRKEVEALQQPEQPVQAQASTSEAVVPMEVDASASTTTTASINPSAVDAATATFNGSATSSSLSTVSDSQYSAPTSAEPSTQNSTLSSTSPSARPASPSSALAEEPAPRRRRTPYRLEVVKRIPHPTGRPALHQSDYQDATEPLENKAEMARKLGLGGVTTMPSATAVEEKKEEDVDMFSPTVKRGEDDAAPASALEAKERPAPAPAPASEPSKSYPLVKEGHYLVAFWDPAAHEYFFGPEADAWGEVEEVVEPSLAAKRANKGKDKKAITLQDCLVEFTKEERLGEDDQWYCSSCKEFKQATKKVELWKVPDVLVFALKRFSSSRYSRDKVDDFVDTPFELDMTPFVEGDKVEKRLTEKVKLEGGGELPPTIEAPDSLTYDLYAVSNHFGGLGGGHYTAFAKNPDNNKWYDFDDSRVSEIPPERVRSSAAYLLFYRRRTARPIGGRRTEELISSANASRAASAAPSLSASIILERPSTGGSDIGDEAPLPGAFSGLQSTGQGTAPPAEDASHRFAGLYNPPSASLPLSPPSSAEPGSPKDMSVFGGEDIDWNSKTAASDGGDYDLPPPASLMMSQSQRDGLGEVEDFLAGGERAQGRERREDKVDEIRVDGQ